MTQEVLKLALEALKEAQTNDDGMEKWDRNKKAIIAIEEALAQPEQDTESHYKGVIEDVQKLFYNKREAQPEQEPVAWIERDMECDDFDPDSVTCEKPTIATDGWEWVGLYTTPPQRKPLTDVIITKVIDSMPRGIRGWMSDWDLYEFARVIEAKLKETT